MKVIIYDLTFLDIMTLVNFHVMNDFGIRMLLISTPCLFDQFKSLVHDKKRIELPVLAEKLDSGKMSFINANFKLKKSHLRIISGKIFADIASKIGLMNIGYEDDRA